MRIALIINPVNLPANHPSYLYYAQPITFESLKIAKNNDIDIQLYTTQYEEDHDIIPDYFIKLPNLTKSIHDYYDFKNKTKKLPVLRDILKILYDNTDAEYLIYSNADIAVKPYFYQYIKEQISLGYDAFCIHRCNINKYNDDKQLCKDDLEIMYKMKGKHTFGHDCFVFHRSLTNKLSLSNVFIGYPPVGTVMKNQLKKHAKKFKEVHSREELTFHLGEDQSWKNKNEYHIMNKQIAGKLQWG